MNPLQSRLAALRRRLRFVVTLRGTCFAAAALLAGLLLGGLFDFLLFERADVETLPLVRAVSLVGTLTITFVIAYRLLIQPLAARTDDLSLALRVEEQYPILNDALASTVQFLEQHPAEELSGTSASLRKEAVQRALRLAQGCDFATAVNPRGLGLAVLTLALVMAALAPLVLMAQARAWTAAQRFADPFGDHPWRNGTETELIVTYPSFLAIGQSLTIIGEVRKFVPAKAIIQFEDNDLQSREVEIKKRDDGTGTFLAGGIKPPSHRREIRFRVRANDAVSPAQTGAWHVVALRQAPQLVALHGKPSPQITLHQPKYTGLPEEQPLPEGTGSLDVWAGTSVTLRGGTDVPIARAWIEFKPLLPGAREMLALSLMGIQQGGVDAAITTGLSSSTWARVPGAIASGGQEFTIRFLPGLTGSYVLTIQDKDGLAKSYEFDLSVRQDPVPVVSLLRPSTSQSVLANADITLQIVADDEVFGLRAVYLEYRRKDKHGMWVDPEPKRLLFYDNDKARLVAPQLLNVFAMAPVPLPAQTVPLQPRHLHLVEHWSLKGLAIEGETIVIQACATDYNDVPAFPQPGRSHEIELKVVGKQGLAQVVDEQEAQVQQQLLKLRDLQDRAIKKLIGVEQQWKATGKLRPEDAVELAEVEDLQKDIRARIGEKKDEGLRGELGQFEQMLKDNKLPNSEVRKRIQDVRDELDRINRENLPKIEAGLDKARADMEAPPKAQTPETNQQPPSELGKARGEQEKVLDTLSDLLKVMEEHSTLQQVKAELRAVLQEQKDRLQEVEKLEAKIIEKKGNAKVLMENQLKSELRRTALLQERLAKRTEKLLDDMEALAAKLEGKDPGLHEMLDRSVKIAKPPANPKEAVHTDLPDAMREAALQLKDEFDLIDPKTRKKSVRLPNVPRARTDMVEIVDILEKMLAALDQSRADELEKLTVNLKKTEKNLDDLGKRIDELKDKIAAAAKIGDPQQREKTLKQLTDELRALQKEAEQKAGDLARLHAQEAAKDVKDAAKKLERVVEELERGDDAKEALEEARAKIDDAQDKLKDANAAAEEELSREKIAKIADRLKGLKERQDAAAVESERLLKSVLQNRKWLRPVFSSLCDLADRQKELSRDAGLVQEKLKGAKVYHAILERTVKDMNAANALIDDHKVRSIKRQDPNVCDDKELLDEKNLAEATIRLQQAASNRLQRLIDALLPELEPPPEPDAKQPGGGKEGAGKDQDKGKKGGIQAQDGIPGVAQLKALKAEQLEVNERTKEFAERHPDFNRLGREEQAELDGIRSEQERLLDLFREMITSAKAEGGNKQ